MSNGIKTVLISELLKYFALELLKMPRIHECYTNLNELKFVVKSLIHDEINATNERIFHKSDLVKIRGSFENSWQKKSP